MHKWIYTFGKNTAEGDARQKDLLGGKGANLAEMSRIGLPVPPGLTITTEACTYYYQHQETLPAELSNQLRTALAAIESSVAAKLGDSKNPLLLSVRSGARVSMPGMMDTILNLGLNDETTKGLATLSGDERFAYDSYRRFIQMYGHVVLGIESYAFEEILEEEKHTKNYHLDVELQAEDWQSIIEKYKDLVLSETKNPFPQNVEEQLMGAILAVFKSWNNQRAKTYRRLHSISDSWGTAVNVQAMVFGNMGDDCGTGVAFTRDPSTGENAFYGEYLLNAQGEDVVAGIRTPQPLNAYSLKASQNNQASTTLEEALPQAYQELSRIRTLLETHFRDMQDIEFTIQKGQLWMLQTRSGKRTTPAGVKIAVEMVQEGLITKEEALLRIKPHTLDQLLHPTLDKTAPKTLFCKGLPASPGAASGKIVFDADLAETWAEKGEAVILVRIETSPDDIHGMHAAKGILTSRGGMTSHAAVVARGMGRACVCGAGGLQINYQEKTVKVAGTILHEGDIITIDGSLGEVYLGKIPMIQPDLSGDFAALMSWADSIRTLKIRANAETTLDVTTALYFGAEGIGLCRTEHMFFDPARINAVRRMIMADSQEQRSTALSDILPMQQQDFFEIFRLMHGLPVTIRLLDPPLHEFLPHLEHEIAEMAHLTNTSIDEVKTRINNLHETNPMLGHRGCRLGISFPEIYNMQIKAIFEAAMLAVSEGIHVFPEIMIPLVSTKQEIALIAKNIQTIAEQIFTAHGKNISYLIGSMIELPRAAIMADELAEHAAFFSFGTNDLTQTTFGLSRDDSNKFLDTYVQKGIFAEDPFMSLDQSGVGQLIALACEKARHTRTDIKLGVCGEHGGDPTSVTFFHNLGLDYVSCSPYRIPIARLAAAQAQILSQKAVLAAKTDIKKVQNSGR